MKKLLVLALLTVVGICSFESQADAKVKVKIIKVVKIKGR